MRNSNQKGRLGNILNSRPVLVLLGALVLFFAYGMVGFIAKMNVTRENRAIAEKKVAELQKSKESLSANIAKLNTEQGVEESIREKFGLVREGEGVIVVVEDKNKIKEEESSGGFFSWFINWFK